MAGSAIAARTVGEQLKAQARRVLEEIFPADDEQALVDTMTDQFVNHEAPPGMPSGPESVCYIMHLLARAFSDQKWTIEEVVAEGDVVAIRSIHSGRHTGDYFGLPATGRAFSYRQMHMVRFDGSKSCEHWAVRDDAGLMRQLTGQH
jgi:predicted ester cyclase